MIIKPFRGALLNRSHPLARGIVGYWLFNEGCGDKIYDLSGNGNTGTLTNMDSDTDWVAGGRGFALDFDGSNDYVEIADHDDFTPALTPFSISVWVYMHDATSFDIASKGVYNVNAEWVFWCDGSGCLSFRVLDESVSSCYRGRYYATPLTAYENQEWIHLVATYNGGILTTSSKLYLNGVRVDDGNLTSGGVFVAVENLPHAVWIGRHGTTNANGLIDNVIIYNRGLTAAEVRQLYINPYQMILQRH